MSPKQLNDKFLTKAKFSQMVERTVMHDRMTYIDAIVFQCEKHGIEVEDSKKYLTPQVKGKVEVEAMKLNYLPKKATLPV